MLLNKKSLRKDLRHFEKEVKQDLRVVETDLAARRINKDQIVKDVAKLSENLEEEIKEVERKLD